MKKPIEVKPQPISYGCVGLALFALAVIITIVIGIYL